MSSPDQDTVSNRLLAALDPADYAALAPHLEGMRLAKGDVLIPPGQPIAQIVFPESGLGSVVARSAEGERTEVGMFGCDGFVGTPVVLGVDRTPLEILIQSEGSYRVTTATLRQVMESRPGIRELLLRYVQAFIIQTSHTALSNAAHTIEERLARWLLMCHDRTDGDDISITHDFLALMLAVRRPSVTTALHTLEGMMLIRNTRGCIHVRDRSGLEELAAAGYGVPEAEYERIIGPLRKRARSLPPPAERGTVVEFGRPAG
jgi:CRP-like cAMP-binding protein